MALVTATMVAVSSGMSSVRDAPGCRNEPCGSPSSGMVMRFVGIGTVTEMSSSSGRSERTEKTSVPELGSQLPAKLAAKAPSRSTSSFTSPPNRASVSVRVSPAPVL